MAYKASLLHSLLESFLRSRSHKVSVLQIGANDGINADFIRSRALNNDWFCVFVEPHPQYFAKLKENYRGLRRAFFENIAVSSSAAELELHYVKEVPAGMEWSMGIASFDRHHLLRHNIAEDNIGLVSVPCRSLQSIVDKYYMYDVDMLVVDVEGHELEVFCSADFSKFQPKMIVFENHHLKADVIDKILAHVGPNYDYCTAEYDGFLLRVRNAVH